MKKIIILIDNIERAIFYFNFIRGAKSYTYQIYTNKPSVKFYIHFLLIKNNIKNVSVAFLKLEKNSDHFSNQIPKHTHISKCVHVVRGTQTIDKANLIYSNIKEALEIDFIKEPNIHLVLLFNGNYALTKAFSDFFCDQNIRVLFNEISNLPAKVIFDPCGVNAQSYLFDNPEFLDLYPTVSDDVHFAWLSQYEDYKLKSIPQSRLNISAIYANIFDHLFWICGVGFNVESVGFISKLSNFFNRKKVKNVTEFISSDILPNDNYVFFPTQVKNDSQLIINSEIDNIAGIKRANEIANKKAFKLVVKIHPAENSPDILYIYETLKSKYNCIFSNHNTNELIKNAQIVVTINSTVGLESLLYGKETIVLGRAIYSKFDFERVKKYIHHYLVNFDYYSDKKISQDELKKVERLSYVNYNIDPAIKFRLSTDHK